MRGLLLRQIEPVGGDSFEHIGRRTDPANTGNKSGNRCIFQERFKQHGEAVFYTQLVYRH